MGTVPGLAVIFIIFVEIIIQCEGNPNTAESSLNRTDVSSINLPSLTYDSLGHIFGKTDLETVRRTLKEVPSAFAPEIVMRGLLENRIVLIDSYRFNGGIREYCQGGYVFLEFGSYQSLESFFGKFSSEVKKISLNYTAMADNVLGKAIPNIIKKCANNLEELRIDTLDDDRVWDEIIGKVIIFPKIKKFQFTGKCKRKEFKLNSLFPNLESVKLSGTIEDTNCLANVTTLKELEQYSSSIREPQLISIFSNNKNITKVTLFAPSETKTMESIAKKLTELKSLHVMYPCGNFFIRTEKQNLYKHPKVTNFYIIFNEMEDLFGDLSFDMPCLKRLTLSGIELDTPIISFIEHFKKLEILQLTSRGYDAVKGIRNIIQKLEESTWTLWYQGLVGRHQCSLFRRQPCIGIDQEHPKFLI